MRITGFVIACMLVLINNSVFCQEGVNVTGAPGIYMNLNGLYGYAGIYGDRPFYQMVEPDIKYTLVFANDQWRFLDGGPTADVLLHSENTTQFDVSKATWEHAVPNVEILKQSRWFCGVTVAFHHGLFDWGGTYYFNGMWDNRARYLKSDGSNRQLMYTNSNAASQNAWTFVHASVTGAFACYANPKNTTFDVTQLSGLPKEWHKMGSASNVTIEHSPCEPCSGLHILNGHAVRDDQESEKLQVHCDPGFKLVGESELECDADGTWGSGTLPQCEVACDRVGLANGTVHMSRFPVVTYSCDGG
eukprot:245466_1